MAEMMQPPGPVAVPDTDLVTAIQAILEASPEPKTLPRIHAALPVRLRSMGMDTLAEVLRRQVAAQVIVQYPKYRSMHDRFWDRPMEVHLAGLVRVALSERALSWSELRRKLPSHTRVMAAQVLEAMLGRGELFRHPPLEGRAGIRYSVHPPDTRLYLRGELTRLFDRLDSLGFTRSEVRATAIEMLHEEEWSK
jgi:hypothetical protein